MVYYKLGDSPNIRLPEDFSKKKPRYKMTEHGRRYKTPSKAIHFFCSQFCKRRKKTQKVFQTAIGKRVYYDTVKFTVEACPYKKKCPIWAYRLGINPFVHKVIHSQEAKDKLREKFNKMWEEKRAKKAEAEKKMLSMMAGKKKNEKNSSDIS